MIFFIGTSPHIRLKTDTTDKHLTVRLEPDATDDSSLNETDGSRETVLSDDDIGLHDTAGRRGWPQPQGRQRGRREIDAHQLSAFERRPGVRSWPRHEAR